MDIKKLSLLLIIVLIIALPNVSSFEFDNIKEYNSQSKTAVFKNSILKIPTSTIAKATLLTPHNVIVPTGYQKVAEFRIDGKKDYKSFLKNMEFYEKRSMKQITRNFDLKVLVNGEWRDLTNHNIKQKETLIIGMFTDVQPGDYIEWIPTLFGIKVNEWATWSNSIYDSMQIYYKLDDSTNPSIDSFNNYNGQVVGQPFNQPGYFNTAYFGNGSRYINTTAYTGSLDATDGSFSVFFWLNRSHNNNAGFLFGDSISGSAEDGTITGWVDNTTKKYQFCLECDTTGKILYGSTSALNVWEHITLTHNATNHEWKFYKNGSLDNSTTQDYTSRTDRYLFLMSRNPVPAGSPMNNFVIDEFGIVNKTLTQSEILEIMNNTYQDRGNLPIIILYSPQDEENYTTSPQTIEFICSGSDWSNLTEIKFYLNGSVDQTNASGLNNTNYTFSKTLTEGYYNWTCEAYNNQSQSFKATERYFKIDGSPPTINLTSPNGTYGYLNNGDNLTLNLSIIDQISNLSVCYYDYNNTINYVPCNGTDAYNIFLNISYEVGEDMVIIFANDTVGNNNTDSKTWIIQITGISKSYSIETTEGNIEDFNETIRLNGLSISQADLIYNSTNYTGEVLTEGLNHVLRYQDFLVPSIINATNITFYWSLLLTNGSIYNLTESNQTIYNFSIDNCLTYSNVILNFTYLDEETQVNLTAIENETTTIDIAVNIYDSSRTTTILSLFDSYENKNPVKFCLSGNLTQSSNYSMDVVIKYNSLESSTEYYNIVGLILTSATPRQDIYLYGLNLSDTTEFQLTFTGSDFLPVENALVYVDRQYISENVFKTVELPKTDYNGQTVLHLVRNDVIYNIRIIKDGEVLGNFENLIAFCKDYTVGDCNIELNAFTSVEEIFNYDESLGIIFSSPEYNETTRIISFSFSTDDGSMKIINMNVTRNDIFGNISICNESLISSSGSLSCSVPSGIDDTQLITTIYVNGQLVGIEKVNLEDRNLGVGGYLVYFVMALALILMLSNSKSGILIAMLLAFVGAIGLGLINSNLFGLASSGTWLIIMVVVGLIKLNKDRFQ